MRKTHFPSKTLTKTLSLSNILELILESKISKIVFVMMVCLFFTTVGFAQGGLDEGNAALQTASDGLSQYYDTFKTIIFILAGIIALLGAIRCFMKWNMGDPDVMSSAAAWFGSAVFLLIAVSILETVFIG